MPAAIGSDAPPPPGRCSLLVVDSIGNSRHQEKPRRNPSASTQERSGKLADEGAMASPAGVFVMVMALVAGCAHARELKQASNLGLVSASAVPAAGRAADLCAAHARVRRHGWLARRHSCALDTAATTTPHAAAHVHAARCSAPRQRALHLQGLIFNPPVIGTPVIPLDPVSTPANPWANFTKEASLLPRDAHSAFWCLP